MAKQWTDEERAAQADRCRQQQPWKHSTGPKTIAGKRKVAGNAPRKPAGWQLSEALWAEAYRRWYDHDDDAGYRELARAAQLVNRRWLHSLKGHPPIKAWKPPVA